MDKLGKEETETEGLYTCCPSALLSVHPNTLSTSSLIETATQHVHFLDHLACLPSGLQTNTRSI